MLFARATLLTALVALLLALGAAAHPCDDVPPGELCLTPLEKHSSLSPVTHDPDAIAAQVTRQRRRRRRRRRPSSLFPSDGDDDEEEEEEEEQEEQEELDGADDEDTSIVDTFDSDDDDDDDDDDGLCFPGDALVRVQGRGQVRMAQLAVGDVVAVGGGHYSSVYVFGHREPHGRYRFVRLETASGGALVASPGHYVYADGQLVEARRVRVGSALQRADGREERVVRVAHHVAKGLFNPHTLHGDVVVDGFRVSAYTTAVHPVVAESLLAPVRAAFRMVGVDVSARLFEGGASKAVLSWLPRSGSVKAA